MIHGKRGGLHSGPARLARLFLPAADADTILGDWLEVEASRDEAASPLQGVRVWLRAALVPLLFWGFEIRFRLNSLAWARPRLEGLARDVRFAVRSPLYVAVVVPTVAITIGVNVLVFTMVNVAQLRPLPAAAPEELVEIYSYRAQGIAAWTSYPDYLDIAANTATLTDVAGHSIFSATASLDEQFTVVFGEFVTGNLFGLLGVEPYTGRWIEPGDDRHPSGRSVVVLGYGFWMDRFDGDPEAIGRSLVLNGQSYEVVGVAPPGFNGLMHVFEAQVWLPSKAAIAIPPRGMLSYQISPGETRLDRRADRWLALKGRLAAGVSVEQAQAELDEVFAALEAQYPGSNGGWLGRALAASSVRLHPEFDPLLRRVSWLALAMAGLVWLSACTHLVSISLARAMARRRELAIRLALGAGGGRLIRQALTESLLLAALGAAAGGALTFGLRRALMHAELGTSLGVVWNLPIDARVLAFFIGLTAITAVAVGLTPALRNTRVRLIATLCSGAPYSGDGRGRRLGFRGVLVISQVAACVVLLVGATMVLRSAHAVSRADLGFDPEGLVVVRVGAESGYRSAVDADAGYRSAVERVAEVPGVTRVGLASRTPMSLDVGLASVFIDGRGQNEPDQGLRIDAATVDAGYFEVLGLRPLTGRLFGPEDQPGSAAVMVVSAAFERAYFPDGAVGQHLHFGHPAGPEYGIIGVVPDTKVQTVGERPRPYLYEAREQVGAASLDFVVRVADDTPEVRTAVHQALREGAPLLSVRPASAIPTDIDRAALPVQFGGALLGSAGALALALVAIGLYGVIAYTASQSAHEISVRQAVGAASADVQLLVLRRGAALGAAGAALGCTAALALSWLLSDMLYNVGAFDPLTFCFVLGIIMLVAGLASWLPARQAARLDPVTALKAE